MIEKDKAVKQDITTSNQSQKKSRNQRFNIALRKTHINEDLSENDEVVEKDSSPPDRSRIRGNTNALHEADANVNFSDYEVVLKHDSSPSNQSRKQSRKQRYNNALQEANADEDLIKEQEEQDSTPSQQSQREQPCKQLN